MNAVEIEEAVTALAERPFDAAEFPFAFLEAFGNKETTIRLARSGGLQIAGGVCGAKLAQTSRFCLMNSLCVETEARQSLAKPILHDPQRDMQHRHGGHRDGPRQHHLLSALARRRFPTTRR